MTDSLVLLAIIFLTGPDGDAETLDADEAAFVGERDGARVYEFEDDSIEGEVLSAEGTNLVSRGSPHHDSLIRVRTSFTPELTRLTLDM